MSIKEAIDVLETHQQWRICGDVDPIEPKELTKAIGMVLFAAKQYIQELES